MSAPDRQRRWGVAETDRAKTAELARALEVPRLAAQLLVQRGLTTPEDARRFLNPSIEQITDPFALTDMRAAVERIHRARADGERVLIFGDYDVDGISGTALLLRALTRCGLANCTYGMPSRLTEGYGLSPDRVEAAHADGVSLIITVDNGITAHEAAATARRLGVDLIVTDHHQTDEKLPDAVAVVNPKREAPGHPSVNASGAAVAFKLACALGDATPDLDLVALGTVADIVPLLGENRALVALGLAAMMHHPRLGIRKLAEAAGLSLDEISSETIAFQLAPRINAAGRLGDGMLPLELLLTDSPEEAERIASELNDANAERRNIERDIYEAAVKVLGPSLHPERHSIVMADDAWHPGVIGIVASRLFTIYNRPVVLLAFDEEGLGRGSARSDPAFDMVGALSACADHLVRFGGHNAAAGLTIRRDRFEAFQKSFEIEARRRLEQGPSSPALEIDAQVALSEIDAPLVRAMALLEPFGHRNPAPVFCAYGVEVLPHSVRELRGGHMRFTAQQGGKVFVCLGFYMADLLDRDLESRPIDIAFTPKFNTWRGETTIQLVLKDVQ